MLKYRLLIFDHDDTAVKSTPEINYPSFLETLSVLRPGLRLSLEEFLRRCCDKGFHRYCTEELGFDEREMDFEYEMWKKYSGSRVPAFHEGVPEVLAAFKKAGGLVCVVSHSSAANIRRDYAAGCPSALPDLVFGWEEGEGRRKPEPWPVLEALRRFGLAREDAVIVDDMLPGLEMAQACSVDFACAGWSHPAPLERAMRESCELYLEGAGDLRELLFS
ncbi:MAG: HAD hydrolase-like protein [Oscillospiraceae bacterium]|nr:HAD hydrolase-like protein [Oscillospiraceae bacterium]